MKELKETVEMMCSNDYKERFIAEYEQNVIRAKKLDNFIAKIKYAKVFNQEVPKHDCPLEILNGQLAIMQLYIATLEIRAEQYENIELPKKEDIVKEGE